MLALGGYRLSRTDPGLVPFALAYLLLFAACARQDAVAPRGGPETPVVSANLSSGSAPEFYVSPTGSPSGDGSSTNPWDLQTALHHPAAVKPGSTIWLRGGTYPSGPYFGGFLSTLTGTADAPIVVRQYPGERATVTDHFYAAGAYTWFWGFEITSSAPTATGTDYEYLVLVYSGVGQRFINLVLHDGSNTGVASFAPLYTTATQTTIHGCLIYNNGTHFNRDHGLYLQNDVATGSVTVTDNIVFNNEAFGLHVYSGLAGGALSGFHIEGNVFFGNGSISTPVNRNNEILIGGAAAASNIVVRDNYTYREVAPAFSPYKMAAAIGYTGGSKANGDVVLENNYFVGGLYMNQWSSAAVRGNLFYDYAGPMVLIEPSVSGYTGGTNQFYGDSTTSSWMHPPNAATDFATWKTQTGFSTPGSFGSGAPPNLVVVRPNQYEPGRANIIVYNWAQQATVSVDLAGVLNVGDRYVVQNVQDFYGTPVASGTYGGGAIQLPMVGITPPAPIGRSFTPPPVTGPTFNAYVVMKTP